MKYYVVIPAYNEEEFLKSALDSLILQDLKASKVLVANDHSTDGTEAIIDAYAAKHNFIEKYNVYSTPEHASGRKVVHAFNQGLEQLDYSFDFIVKMDADIVVPPTYFKKIAEIFSNNERVGIAGGFAYEKNDGGIWKLNHPMHKDHVRGGFKSYTSACFKAIGGLKPSIGWDTVDELLARYHGFKIYTDASLKVKHLRPLGAAYSKKSWEMQGEALYRMRYGWLLALIATIKMAFKHKKVKILLANYRGYMRTKKEGLPYLVTAEEGAFIRRFRWEKIFSKFTIG